MPTQLKIITKISIAALFALSTYFLLSPLILSNILLFQPQKVEGYSGIPLKVFGATQQEVSFSTPSGHQLHGLYFDKPNSKLTVLLHHGQGGNVSTHFGLASMEYRQHEVQQQNAPKASDY